MKRLAPELAYRLLEAGPVVLVTTAYAGRRNIMTAGFHMMVRHAPPQVAVVVGPWDFSHEALVATGECVIAVPTVDLAGAVVDIGNCSGADVDKFARFGLTAQAACAVGAPLIDECIANLECRVIDDSLDDRFAIHILEVVAIHYDDARAERRTLHHNGDGTFTLDGEVLDLKARMVRWKGFQRDL